MRDGVLKLSSGLGKTERAGRWSSWRLVHTTHKNGGPFHGVLVLPWAFSFLFSCWSPPLPTSVTHPVNIQYLPGALHCAQRCGATKTPSVMGHHGGLLSEWNCMRHIPHRQDLMDADCELASGRKPGRSQCFIPSLVCSRTLGKSLSLLGPHISNL